MSDRQHLTVLRKSCKTLMGVAGVGFCQDLDQEESLENPNPVFRVVLTSSLCADQAQDDGHTISTKIEVFV